MGMIKKFSVNKIVVTSFALFLILMFYLIPTKPKFESEVINDKLEEKNVIYLLDDDNYVSKVISYFDNDNITDEITNKLNKLIYGDDSLINFYPLIPKGTKINKIDVKENSVYIDFSNEIKNVSEYLEEKMLESIIFTLTEINGIDNIYISIDGVEYNKMITTGEKIPYPLNESFGINKEYNIFDLNNINKTTVFFNKKVDDIEYYVPVTKINNLSYDKVDIIIEELKSSINSQKKLNSFVNSNLKLVNYEEKDNKMYLVFNEYIFSDSSNSDILESVKYVISQSVFANYDVDYVIFNTESANNIEIVSKNA